MKSTDETTATDLSDAPEDIKAQILSNDQKLREQDKGYKETTVTWLNPKCQVISNSDIPIVGDIAVALGMIPELVKRARIDRLVDECAKWLLRRT